jgi:hypothetical protein
VSEGHGALVKMPRRNTSFVSHKSSKIFVYNSWDSLIEVQKCRLEKREKINPVDVFD